MAVTVEAKFLAVEGEAKFLAVGETCKAIFPPAPGFKEGIFESSRIAAEGGGTLISASAVPRREWFETIAQ